MDAVILGLYGANALGVARSLGAEHISVFGVHNSRRFPHAAYSKHLIGHYNSFGEESLTLLALRDAASSDKPVLFPIGDRNVIFIHRHRDFLDNYYHLPLLKGVSIDYALNKNNILHLGKAAGFKVPDSSLLSENILFEPPYILKPLNSSLGGKSDFYFFKDSSALRSARDSLLDRYGDMVVQEFVPGGVSENYEVHLYKGLSEITIGGMLQKLLAVDNLVPGSLGSLVRSVWEEQLVAPSLRLAERLDYVGLLDINLKRHSQTGDFYFLEVNYRSSANLILDSTFGVNLPVVMFMDFKKLFPPFLEKSDYYLSSYWIDEFRFDPSTNKGYQPLNWRKRPLIRAWYDPEDPLPYHTARLVHF